jgi:hypothetical protein
MPQYWSAMLGTRGNAVHRQPHSGDPAPGFYGEATPRRGEIDVLLTAVAIGLAALDFTYFAAIRVSAQIGRSQFAVNPTEQVMQSVRQPFAAMLPSSISSSRAHSPRAEIELDQCHATGTA